MFLVAENILPAGPPPQKGFLPWSSSAPGFLVTSKPGWAGGSQPSQTPEAENEEGHSHWEKNQGDQAGPNKIVPIACGLYRKVSYTDTRVCVLHMRTTDAYVEQSLLSWSGWGTRLKGQKHLGNPRTEEPGGKRVGHDLATNSSNVCVCVCVCVCVYD